MAKMTNKEGELLFGESHILCNLFSIEAIEKISKNKLEYHTAFKKADYLNEEGECIDEAVTNDKELVWYTSLDGIASVDNGVVTRKNYGQVTVYAVPTDGAQKKDAYALFGKCNIHFVKGFAAGINFEKDNITFE